jgi:hypothetical protein
MAEVGALIQAKRARTTIAVAWVFLDANAANMRAERELRRQTSGVVVLNPVQANDGQQ